MERVNKEFFKYWNQYYEKMIMPVDKKKELRKVVYHAFVNGYKVNKEVEDEEIK